MVNMYISLIDFTSTVKRLNLRYLYLSDYNVKPDKCNLFSYYEQFLRNMLQTGINVKSTYL